MACKGECRTRYLDASLTDRRETVMLVLGDLGVISSDLKCLLKTEQELIRNEAQGFFISEREMLRFTKQQSGSLGQLVVQQQR